MPSTARYTPRLIVRHGIEDRSSTNTIQTASVVRKQYERGAAEMTHGCRDFIILVDPTADANPECNEYPNEAYNLKSKATCFDSYPPQSCYERVDSKYL
jgi:hypothetical protein